MSAWETQMLDGLLRSWISGGLVLLLGWWMACLVRAPAARQRLGEAAAVVALVCVLVGFLPPQWYWANCAAGPGLSERVTAITRAEQNPVPAWTGLAAATATVADTMDPSQPIRESPQPSQKASPPASIAEKGSAWQQGASPSFATGGCRSVDRPIVDDSHPQNAPIPSSDSSNSRLAIGREGFAHRPGLAGSHAATPYQEIAPSETVANRAAQQRHGWDVMAMGGLYWGLRSAVAIWLVGAVGLSVRLAAGCWRLRQMVKKTRPAPAALAATFQQLADTICPRARLRISDGIELACSWGWRQPLVLVPSHWLVQLQPRDWQSVFRHELTHLARGDTVSAAVFSTAAIWFWFVPWFWWLRRQVRCAQEYIADYQATQGDLERAADYAELLVRLVSRARPHLLTASIHGTGSELQRRIAMLLQGTVKSLPGTRWWLIGGLASLLAAGVLLASGGWLSAGTASKNQPSATPDKAATKEATPRQDIVGDQTQNNAASQAKETEQQKPKPDSEQRTPARDRRDSPQQSDKPRPRDRSLPEPFGELDELLKEPPPGIDPQEWQRLREMLRRQQEELRQMLEQLHRGPLPEDRRRILPPPGLRPPWFAEPAQRHPRLGVIVEPLHPALRDQLSVADDQGVLVREVVPDSPAAKVGIKPHDILLEIGGKAVPADPEAFVRLVRELPAGKVGKVVVLRKGKKETLGELELPEQPQPQVRPPVRPIPRSPVEPAPQAGYWLHVERSGDGSFRVQYREPHQTIRIEGHQADDKVTVSKIEITEGRETKSYDSLDAVPAATRDKVNKLLDSALKGRFFVPEPQQPKRFD